MRALIYKDYQQTRIYWVASLILTVALALAVLVLLDAPSRYWAVPVVTLFRSLSSIPMVFATDTKSRFEIFALGGVMSPREYIAGKYFFTWIDVVAALLLSLSVGILVEDISAAEMIYLVSITLSVPLLLSALFSPVIIRFEAEKARMVLMGMMVVLYLLIYFGRNYFQRMFVWLLSLTASPWVIALMILLISLILHALSFLLCTHLQSRKEY